MAKLDISRSVKFVSLDSHPANDVLVINYEAMVVVHDTESGQELTRRSKRDHFQLKLTTLDQVGETGSRNLSDKIARMSDAIFEICPLLAGERNRVAEELRLNLIYLMNRKQAQRSNLETTNRPPSSASVRLRSSNLAVARNPSRLRTTSASSINRPNSRPSESSIGTDVYEAYYRKELRTDAAEFAANDKQLFLEEQTESLLAKLNEQLEIDLDATGANKHLDYDLDMHLESLYGEQSERLEAIRFIKQLADDEIRLVDTFKNSGNNNLLVSALMRILRHSQGQSSPRDQIMTDCIWYSLIRSVQNGCLVHLTNSSNVLNDCLQLSLDTLDRLASDASPLKSGNRSRELVSMALISTLLHLILSDDTEGREENSTERLIYTNTERLVQTIANICNIHASMGIQSTGFIDNSIWSNSDSDERASILRFSLAKLLHLACSLSLRETFTNTLRLKKFSKLHYDLIQLADTLQAQRIAIPNGSSQASNIEANELFELETKLWLFIGNLVCDRRLATLFVSTGSNGLLLKCVLRNLVCLIANSSNSVVKYSQSQLLLAPLRCLYKLSCSDNIKQQLFKSRIIIKCLLDYLQVFVSSLAEQIDLSSMASLARNSNNFNSLKTSDINQIFLSQPLQADHYILGLWLNLSSHHSLPIYSCESVTDPSGRLREQLRNYCSSLLASINKHVQANACSMIEPIPSICSELVYLHAKLVRNFTQHIQIEPVDSESHAIFNEWCRNCINKLVDSLQKMMANSVESIPVILESLAILTNLLDKSAASIWANLDSEQSLVKLLDALLFGPLGDLDTLDSENDDLLIVSFRFISVSVRRFEICNQMTMRLFGDLLRLCLFVFTNKPSDTEMTICSLFALLQLSKHSKFVGELVSLVSNDEDSQARLQVYTSHQIEAGQELVDKLCAMLLQGDIGIVRLANLILSRIKQVDEQLSLNDSVAGVRRFECYNSRWLQTIRTAGDDLLSMCDDTANHVVDSADSPVIFDDDDYDQYHNIDDDLSQLRAFGQERGNKSQEDDSELSPNEDDLLIEEEEFESELLAPDASVIDEKTMIKHLAKKF